MTPGERTKYFFLLSGRTVSSLLDIFGLALVGVLASLGAGALTSQSSGGKPITFAGISFPALNTADLVWLAAIILVVFVAKAVLAVFLSRKLAYMVAAVEARNAQIIVASLLRGSLSDAKKHSKAEFQYAITGSTSSAFSGVLNAFATVVSEGFLLLLISAAFFLVNAVAALFALLYFAALALVIQYLLGRTLKRAGAEAAGGTIDSTNLLSDTLDTFRELSVMDKQQLYITQLGSARLRLANSSATFAFMGGMPRYIVETALIVGVVALVGQQMLAGNLAAGLVTVGVFLTGGTRIMASLLPLQASLGQLKLNMAQAVLAHKFLGEHRNRPVAAAAPHGIDVATLVGSALPVSISRASFTYEGTNEMALDSVSLTASPGQFVAIIGPSGAGKTTLVDLLLGLIPPAIGEVHIGPVTPSELRQIAPGVISYVPQKPGMVSGSIAENIALGVPRAEIDEERLGEVIEAAYLTEFIDGLPQGVDTTVGKQVNSLSGGQIQRIGLARALYTRPRLLIMDEATSALDAGSEAFISDSLQRLRGQVTLVVIAHRLSTVQHADNVYVMEGGTITAEGSFPTLVDTVPMVAEFVKLMSFDGVEPSDDFELEESGEPRE